MSYNCERCGKSFSQKSGLNRHQKKKRPCQSNHNKYQCLHCGKLFKHYQSRWRHEKNCSQNKSDDLTDLIKLVKDQNNLHIKEKATWEKEKTDLKNCINKILNKLATPTNITNNTYNIVQINNFGNENISYIQTNFLQRLLKTPNSAVPELLKQIHFHPDHPENRNIKITNHRERFAHVFRNQEWQLARKDEILDEMVESGFTLLDTCFEENENELSDGKKKRYQHFQEKMDQEQSKTRKRVTQDTEMMVLNQSKKN